MIPIIAELGRIRPTWAIAWVMTFLGVLLGWTLRGCAPDERVKDAIDSYRGSPGVTERIIERPVFDTVTKIVYQDRIRIVQAPATTVSILRPDTVITTHPFRARLDTVVNNADTVKILFDYPPATFALVDVRHTPDTVRSILERRGLDRIIEVKLGLWETIGRAGGKGIAVGSLFWYLNDQTRPAQQSSGMNVLESIGAGVATMVVTDTLEYILDN